MNTRNNYLHFLAAIAAATTLLLTASAAFGQGHSADINADGRCSLTEVLRVIQFFNSGGLHCAPGTEDGFAPGPGGNACAAHSSDYNPQDWDINLSELLRIIQFYNAAGFHAQWGTEDGFAPGMPPHEGAPEGEHGGEPEGNEEEGSGQNDCEEVPVRMIPLPERFGFGLAGPYDFTGILTKNAVDTSAWLLTGAFTFPTSGYSVASPVVQVRESDPEQATVSIGVTQPSPDLPVLQVLTRVAVSAEIPVSSEAHFAIQVVICTPQPPFEGEGLAEGEGITEGGEEGAFEGEGLAEGEGITEGGQEGAFEGEGLAEGEGTTEGGQEGAFEGEGLAEGEGEWPADTAWIPGETSPQAWTVQPGAPTVADVIQFSGPTNVYSNLCTALTTLGQPELVVDHAAHRVELAFVPVYTLVACADIWQPVCGIAGSFGPLEAGPWVFFADNAADPQANFSISFQVNPDGPDVARLCDYVPLADNNTWNYRPWNSLLTVLYPVRVTEHAVLDGINLWKLSTGGYLGYAEGYLNLFAENGEEVSAGANLDIRTPLLPETAVIGAPMETPLLGTLVAHRGPLSKMLAQFTPVPLPDVPLGEQADTLAFVGENSTGGAAGSVLIFARDLGLVYAHVPEQYVAFSMLPLQNILLLNNVEIAGNDSCLPRPPDPHLAEVMDDKDGDYLADREEDALGNDPSNPDENRNSVPDGVDLALTLAQAIRQMPCFEAAGHPDYGLYPPELVDEFPLDKPYVIRFDYLVDCVWTCPVCDASLPIGHLQVVNPLIHENWRGGFRIPVGAWHYLQHGAFAFMGRECGTSETERLDVPGLVRAVTATPANMTPAHWISCETSPKEWHVEILPLGIALNGIRIAGPTPAFGNDCEGNTGLGGRPFIAINAHSNALTLVAIGPPPQECYDLYAPVCGLNAQIIGLANGLWTFSAPFLNPPVDLTFAIGPEAE